MGTKPMCLGLHESAPVDVTVDKQACVDTAFYFIKMSHKIKPYIATQRMQSNLYTAYCAQINIIQGC